MNEYRRSLLPNAKERERHEGIVGVLGFGWGATSVVAFLSPLPTWGALAWVVLYFLALAVYAIAKDPA